MKKQKRKKDIGGVTTLSIRPPVIKPSAVQSEVVVPVLWAVLLAGSIGLVATLAAVALRQVLAVNWPWWLPMAAGGSTAAVVFCWRCTVGERDRRALLLWPIESTLNADLNGDGYIGEPEPEPEVEVEPVAAPRLIYVHNGAYKAQHDQGASDFRFFLRGAYGEKGTTWRAWDNAPLPSGKALSRPVWEMWTGRLVQSGLASREYPTAPLVLVDTYRQALHTLRNVL